MKKFLPLLIVIVLCVGIGYVIINNESFDNDSADIVSNKRIIELSENPAEMLQFIYEVKQEPVSAMSTFNVLRKLIYSNDYKDKALERLVNMQRLLYHETILEQNQKDLHLTRIEADLQKWKERDFKLIGSDMLPPTYDGEDNQICFIKVVFYTNTPEEGTDIYVIYELLEDENGQWDILAWESIDPFEIIK